MSPAELKKVSPENTKLLKLLSSLSAIEFRELGDFVNSPFFNKSEKLTGLFNFIKDYYPKFDNKELNRRYLFEVMYPGEPYKDKKLRDRFSDMIKLVENYLIQLQFRKHEFYQGAYLAEQYGQRNQVSLFDKKIEELKNYNENCEIKDEEYYLRNYFICNLRLEHEEGRIHAGKLDKLYSNIITKGENLAVYTIINLLKNHIWAMDAEAIIVKFSSENKVYNNFIPYIEKECSNYSHIPAVCILYKFFQLYRIRDLELYKEIKSLLSQNTNIFNKEDLTLLYGILHNICIVEGSKGNENYKKEEYELLKFRIKEGLIFDKDGFLNSHNYINYAAAFLFENELKTAEDFILKYKNKIRTDMRDNAFNYCLSMLHYKKGVLEPVRKKDHYKKALRQIVYIKNEDFYYYTRIKRIEFNIFYEMLDTDQLLSSISSYKKVISKYKQIPDAEKTRNINYANALYKLTLLRERNDTEGLMEMKKDLMNRTDIEFRNWLIRKIDEICTFQ